MSQSMSSPPQKVINMWSGPRNISTAMMYSFAQRSDMTVIDEPLYGHFLSKTDAVRPARELVLQTMETDGSKIMQAALNAPCPTPFLFLKNMPQQLVGMTLDNPHRFTHFFLIRHPKDVIVSFSKVVEQPTMQDIAIKEQYDFYQTLLAEGIEAPVFSSVQILQNPEKSLRQLCQAIAIPFDPAMLQWEAGQKPYDGCWWPYWYANVHRSTGFQKYVYQEKQVPKHLENLLEEALPFYHFLENRLVNS